MKNNNTVEACTHCHVCQNQCEFLKKYGIDIGDTEKLKELIIVSCVESAQRYALRILMEESIF